MKKIPPTRFILHMWLKGYEEVISRGFSNLDDAIIVAHKLMAIEEKSGHPNFWLSRNLKWENSEGSYFEITQIY